MSVDALYTDEQVIVCNISALRKIERTRIKSHSAKLELNSSTGTKGKHLVLHFSVKFFFSLFVLIYKHFLLLNISTKVICITWTEPKTIINKQVQLHHKPCIYICKLSKQCASED